MSKRLFIRQPLGNGSKASDDRGSHEDAAASVVAGISAAADADARSRRTFAVTRQPFRDRPHVNGRRGRGFTLRLRVSTSRADEQLTMIHIRLCATNGLHSVGLQKQRTGVVTLNLIPKTPE